MAPLPEIEPLLKPIAFGLEDDQVGFLNVFPGLRVGHLSQVPLRR